MGGNLDIVARLQLRAEQFSSEIGSQFADMKVRAASTAQEVRSSFLGSFAEVQKVAQTALTLPRTSAGSLDLSSEIAQLRESAAAMDQRAIAAREISVAFTAAAASGRGDAEALRQNADAAAVAALSEEKAAAAVRLRIDGYEAANIELAKSTSMTREASQATRDHATRLDEVTAHSGRMSIAQMEMMHVVRASSDAFAAGAPLSQIFAMEIGRVGEAAALSGGALGSLGTFLAGPWGIALTAALAISAPFIAKLLEGGDAAKDQADKLSQATAAADSYGTAQSLLGRIIDLTTGKLTSQNAVLIQSIKLQAQANILAAQSAQNKLLGRSQAEEKPKLDFANPATPSVGETFSDLASVFVGNTSGRNSIQQFQYVVSQRVAQLGPITQQLSAYKAAAQSYADVLNDPKASPTQLAAASGKFDTALNNTIDTIGNSAKRAGRDVTDVTANVLALGKALNDQRANRDVITAANGGPLGPELKKKAKERKQRVRKPRDRSNESAGAAEEIARINAEWTDQPKLIEKAAIETLKLDNLIAKLKRDKPPNFEKLIADAQAAEGAIRDGMDRPYQQFVRTQKEGLEVQRLILSGRDDEAAALQNAIQLQHTQGPLDQAHLATILRTAQQQRAIAEALEDQRRIVGLYSGAVGEMQQGFDQFLEKLRTKPSDALKSIVSSTFASFNHLTDGLLSNSLFGGISRDVESYVRKMTGKQTPAEILETQAHDAGATLKTSADKLGDQFDRFGDRVREITSSIGGYGNAGAIPANDNASPSLIAQLAKGNGVTGPYMDDITVTGKRLGSDNVLAGALGVGIDRFTKNLEQLGIKMPQAITDGLKKNLPDVLAGAKFGALGGSVFSEITGGKQSALGEAAGGALGEKAGKALEKPLTAIFGKTLGSFAGPLGGILGGVLGDVVGGLFRSTPKASAGINVSNGSITATKASGNNADATSQASSLAGSVAQGLSQIAEQLGAAVTGSTDVKIGTYNGQWRVNDHGGAIGGVKGSGAISFDTQQEAISYAISDALKDGVLSGISNASLAILRSGQDLSTAISKALMIEQIPKDLKAMLDPVGAAVDALNTKWKKTVAALKEGGATAEQMAQAQQLYNLQLDQTKASTDAADKTLQDFLTSLKVGSSSPYSLRDQEATAKTNLQPFLDAINGGQAIDQSKYQTAAQSYLDVERQLYGSTKQYFDAMDAVQAATNKAISTIDNATPVTTAVESPFASATATSTATTANNTGTANDLLSQNSDLLSGISTKLDTLINVSGGGGSSFIGSGRNYVQAA